MTKFEMEWVRHLLKDCFERLCHTENMTLFYQSNLFDVSSICALFEHFHKIWEMICFHKQMENEFMALVFKVLFFMFPCEPVFLVIVVSRVNSHDLI